MSLVIAWNLVTRSRQGSAPPRRRQLKLPTLADILIHEVLSGGTAAQEWSTDVRPLEQLAILAFWRISEKGEDCLCGTIPGDDPPVDTYGAAATNNVQQTALEAGNSAATILSHYRALANRRRRQGIVRHRAAPLGFKNVAPAPGEGGANGPSRSWDNSPARLAWFVIRPLVGIPMHVEELHG